MKKKGKIQIELQSDLCVASGYSFDGIIDTDICYDTLGIPYIPAKRLKGCFKETAESVLYRILEDEDIKHIFGGWGEKSLQGIVIGNAYIKNYEQIREELNTLFSMQSKKDAYVIDAQKILEQFTHIQANTAIGYTDDAQGSKTVYDGAAKDNSLRYTRVVNQYSPIDGENLVFEADIQYDAVDEKKIENILSGTRNIGLKRNRGLGSVKCTLNNKIEIEEVDMSEVGDSDNTVCVNYVLKNLEPLVLSDKNDQKTMDYIKGQTIIGALAARYLQINENSADDIAFKDLFLNGSTIFTDAMPYKDGRTYYPAPLFINKLKKTKDIVNVIPIYKEQKKYSNKTKDGNLPKKLKGKYVYVASDFKEIDVLEVTKQICYHHSHKSVKNSDEKDALFAFEAICENQEFAGKIILSKKYKKLIENLLKAGDLNIGKSKSAQYGSCQVNIINSGCDTKRKFLKGNVISVTLQSDMVLHNGVDYTIFYDDVYEMIAKELGIVYERECEENTYSIISTKEITGYLSVWNMRKSPIPAIAAGSMFSYKLKEDFEIPKEFCGERCLEGYGNIRVDYLEMNEIDIKNIETTADDKKAVADITKPLFNKIFLHDLEMELISKGIDDKFKLNQSKIGRVILMLKESIDENKKDYMKAFKSFEKRVDSIKSEDDKKLINDKIVKEIFKKQDQKEILNVVMDKLSIWNKMKEVGFSKDECIDMLNSLWGRYVLMILVNQKYENKNQGDVQ